MSSATIVAPRAASSTAVALPIPEPAPVTMAILPSSCLSISPPSLIAWFATAISAPVDTANRQTPRIGSPLGSQNNFDGSRPTVVGDLQRVAVALEREVVGDDHLVRRQPARKH